MQNLEPALHLIIEGENQKSVWKNFARMMEKGLSLPQNSLPNYKKKPR
jgi:hypothetical protein